MLSSSEVRAITDPRERNLADAASIGKFQVTGSAGS